MKKLLLPIFITILFFSFYISTNLVNADECPLGQICNPLTTDSFEDLLGAITNFIFWVGMALAPVMLIIAGFMFVTSAGSPERVKTAQKMALYTVIGLAIILLASGLVAVLKSIIGYQD